MAAEKSSAGNKCKLFVPTFVIIECYAPFACTTLSISLMYAIGVRNVNAIEKKNVAMSFVTAFVSHPCLHEQIVIQTNHVCTIVMTLV